MSLRSMPEGVRGEALFSHEDPPLYRYSLRRHWGPIHAHHKYILFIGHNPSVAGRSVDDPSIFKECKFARDLGYSNYHKLNIMDRIGTEPAELLTFDRAALSSPFNNNRILRAAGNADKIVCCWGSPAAPLRMFAETTEEKLRAAGHKLYCLARNADGMPKHPLYIADGTPLELFDRR